MARVQIDDQERRTAFMAKNGFKAMPNWASWSGEEASKYVHDNILTGQTVDQVNTWIDTNVTNIATARTALKQLAGAIISIRTILMAIAKAVMFLRDWR